MPPPPFPTEELTAEENFPNGAYVLLEYESFTCNYVIFSFWFILCNNNWILVKYDPFHLIVNNDLRKQTLRRIQPILADWQKLEDHCH